MFQAKKPMKGIWVRIEGAQRPNPDSRITLNNDVDVFGMRRVTLDWRITDEDYDNLYQTSIAFARGVGAAGFGRMILEISEQKNLSKITGTGHHLGTTRMHDDPQHGVVDQNCKVHDLDNLFIAGSSVFSTGPRVNPTLNIIALAIRLADHLRTKVKAA
jgi:choline dehydrogenase-like flavoprotein